ncbi:MAG: Crp/Fnr family transcriptional regulator [Deltaproteobacteria bacterium]|nr:Crp/Fnr family transcriptional regulator [Deltaproteobacteria bacterium]
MLIITEGELNITLYSASGREVVITRLGAGEVVGEMALLDDQPRSASAVGATNGRALVLRRGPFQKFLREHPDSCLELLKELTRRLRTTNAKLTDLALLDVYGRVARFLIRLAEEKGTGDEAGVLIPERPTHLEIAGLVGTSRETVSRAMSDLVKAGSIEYRGKGLFIPPSGLDALEDAAE